MPVTGRAELGLILALVGIVSVLVGFGRYREEGVSLGKASAATMRPEGKKFYWGGLALLLLGLVLMFLF